MRILVVGALGLLGTTVHRTARDHPGVSEVVAAGRDDIDITEPDQVTRAVREIRPDAVINTAVLMPADRCDDDPQQAYAVNALGARWVARAAAEVDATVVYVTTDFVFDGVAAQPYGPDHAARPVLTYGTTKLAGEHETRLANGRHLILRTAGLFGPRPISPRARACFVDRMLDRAVAGDRLRVVEHVQMSPTYTADLARVMLAMLSGATPSGTYHSVNRGVASWYEVCREALSHAGLADLVSPTTDDGFTTAARPPSTPLRCTVPGRFGPLLGDWRAALHGYLRASRPAPSGTRLIA